MKYHDALELHENSTHPDEPITFRPVSQGKLFFRDNSATILIIAALLVVIAFGIAGFLFYYAGS